MDRKQLLTIAAGGGAATVIGIFLPWASFSDEGMGAALKALGQSASRSGLDTGDGKIVLVLALIGTVLAAATLLGKALPLSRKASMLICMISLALAAVVCVIDFLDISGPLSVGIGLWLCLAGSIAGAATSFLAWRQLRGEPSAAPQAAKTPS